MPPSESDLLGLIELIYDTTAEPSRWPELLEGIAAAMTADVTFVQRHKLAARTSRMITTFGLNNRFRDSYNQHYTRVNIWRDRGARMFIQGKAVLDEQMCPRAELVKSEFYNDFLVPMGSVRCASGVVLREGHEALMLAGMRCQSRPAFEEGDRRALELLLPHVLRAHLIAERLQRVEGSEWVLETLGASVVFLTASAGVLHTTASAERILSVGDGLSVRNGTLCAADSTADAHVRQAVRTAASTTDSVAAPETVLVDRPSLKRPYQLLMSPLRHGLREFAGTRSPQVVAVIIDPESHAPTAPDVLVRLFALTRREAALASALSSGETLEDAADRLRMTYQTARSHLRRIFDKTSTSRQTQLVMMLARLPKKTGDTT